MVDFFDKILAEYIADFANQYPGYESQLYNKYKHNPNSMPPPAKPTIVHWFLLLVLVICLIVLSFACYYGNELLTTMSIAASVISSVLFGYTLMNSYKQQIHKKVYNEFKQVPQPQN